MATLSPFPPGSAVSLKLDDHRQLTFTVIKPFEPFTQSVVLLARCDSFSQTPSVVIKLFDPRHHHERFRKIKCCGRERTWTLEAELAALEDPEPIRWGDAELKFIPEELYESSSDSEPEDEDEQAVAHRAARWEKHFQEIVQDSFETEFKAYTRLQDLQGTAIPRLLAVGRYITADERRIEPRAIVLEYIDGVQAQEAPAEALTPLIIAQLYRDLGRINEYGVVHNDLNWGNFIITPSRGVVIDFGLAVLKETAEDEEEWKEVVRFNCEPYAIRALVIGKRIEWKEEFGMPSYTLPPARTKAGLFRAHCTL
ncbi:hypothetical protein PENSPDRAFT_655057 [Peniophora sp. CONT]|nr:hypothetical protein PENSPDRAFT_655057 [Peniophora sp. CONT]